MIIYLYVYHKYFPLFSFQSTPQRIPGPIPSKWRQSLEVWQVGHLEPAHLQH